MFVFEYPRAARTNRGQRAEKDEGVGAAIVPLSYHTDGASRSVAGLRARAASRTAERAHASASLSV